MADFFTVKFRVLEFNKRGYTEALQKVIDVQIRQAARAWLRAVVEEVPVYSGQARASLLPLGRFLRVSIDTTPDPIGKKRYPEGVSIGQTQSFYEFTHEGYISKFRFNTEVPHYLINEFNTGLGSPPLRHPTPWHSLDAGEVAFKDYLRTNLKKRIPKISKYIVMSKRSGD